MIRFDHLTAGYDGVQVLRGVDLAIPAGKLTALIGPNGCGKSTLLKTAAGILKPLSGNVYIAGKPVSGMEPRALAKLTAYMPQSRPAPEMTVRQLASHGRYPHLKWGRGLTERDNEVIRSAMARAGVDHLSGKRIDRISGGERQRAYLSMMLAQQTPVMLLDEPDTYLDPGARFDLAALLKDLAGEGRTVLAVMHDVSLALGCCDHVILMNGGAVIASGTPEDLCATDLIRTAFGVRVIRIPDESGKGYIYAFAPHA